MEVSASDRVKIYNLSTGDSVPEWISSKKLRKLQELRGDYKNGIRLIQEFHMPDSSSSLAICKDGRHIFATGIYKPTLKCYNVDDMSMKFEHGIDTYTLKVLPISDDYSKVVLLQDMRFLEIFSNGCRYYRFRAPRTNRDMTYSSESSDLFIVGNGSEVYRFNMELGRFVSSMSSSSPASNCCELSEHHHLLLCGTVDGHVEAYDHRDPVKVGTMDCGISKLGYNIERLFGKTPEVTCINYKDAMKFAVGTSTGHVLLYDLRSSKPLMVKDHNIGLPIKKVSFVKEQDIVLSMDSRILKFWEEDSGKPVGAIESAEPFVDFVRYPDSGLLFFAVDAPEMQQYFVPSFGPAPKWCYHLDSIVEELEDTKAPEIYDDYKFVTHEQLKELGLEQLVGTNVLRAHMHGYFMDVRLYNRAMAIVKPDPVQTKRRNLRERMEKSSLALPQPKDAIVSKAKVNKEFAKVLAKNSTIKGKRLQEKAEIASTILEDDRFSALFKEQEYTIDQDSETYLKMASIAEKQDEKNQKRRIKTYSDDEEQEQPQNAIQSGLFMDDEPMEDEDMTADFQKDERMESDEDSDGEEDDSDDGYELQDKEAVTDSEEESDTEEFTEPEVRKPKGFKFMAVENRRQLNAILAGEKAADVDEEETFGKRKQKIDKQILNMEDTPFGTKSITFTVKSEKDAALEKKQKLHLKERRDAQRSAGSVLRTLKPLPSHIQGKSYTKRKK